MFGARIFIRFESAESTARLPAAFAPVSEKAHFRFEVPSPLTSAPSSEFGRTTPVPLNFDGAAFAMKKTSQARNPGALVRTEYVAWDDVRELLRSDLNPDRIYSEQMDSVTFSRNLETEPGNVDARDCGNNTCSHSVSSIERRVLSCEITRAGEGGTFVQFPFFLSRALFLCILGITFAGRACPRRLHFSISHLSG